MALSSATPEATAPVLTCDTTDLTVENAAALQRFLLQALLQSKPVCLAHTQDIDLAGVQLLLAFALQRRGQGLAAFAQPLPPQVARALALAGCNDAIETEPQ